MLGQLLVQPGVRTQQDDVPVAVAPEEADVGALVAAVRSAGYDAVPTSEDVSAEEHAERRRLALHAQTHEGKLQVELAQLEYRLPRLTRMWTHLSRTGGGIGTSPTETLMVNGASSWVKP